MDLVYDVITNIEFWMSFILKQFINEITKDKSMNTLKSVIIGVGAIMWSHTQIRFVEQINSTSTRQDNSKGVRLPLSTF